MCPAGHEVEWFRLFNRVTGVFSEKEYSVNEGSRSGHAPRTARTGPQSAEALPAKMNGGRALKVLESGTFTDKDFARLMVAVAMDVLKGDVKPAAGQVALGAADRILALAEFRLKGGRQLRVTSDGSLLLTSGDGSAD